LLYSAILTVAGFAAAYLPVLLRLPDAPPWVAFVLFGAAIAVAVLAWRRRRGAKRIAGAGAVVLAGAGYAYWFFFASAYGRVSEGPTIGHDAPAVEATRALDGATFRLAEERGRAVFLVFFRGSG